MSMPPGLDEPQFILHRSYGNYRILIKDVDGTYRTLLAMDGSYNWADAAEKVLDALISIGPTIHPQPHDGSTK